MPLPGCYQIHPHVLADPRGHFVKTFQSSAFRAHGLADNFAETFYSVSRKGVLRGFHFQVPPHEHAKLVYCTAGAVLDAVVDIRRGSPTEAQFTTFELIAEHAAMVYIPAGFAHAFYALTDSATVAYQVTTEFAPEHDAGVRWDSFGVPWPDPNPILSAKDMALPLWQDFDTPFTLASAPKD
ncbi:dTDP-4-dehydrorhamnose 3,5-epimerase family protein [Acidovorax sp. NCPPB 3576]|uniref:dTDP-4-dehydrorhamnose 3,5-epimerase family protein n=1 Tax=Acidovorax sp. NCPPB 3576 TaxID=2940488 RepID=UPI00234AEF38|nr:dTDP-4-dehydrorhamnose 3,5-epimerase family protein [Acidovorax sp. NCPPB 3576]WCM88961.1 dTDP-4-dehydrorhamnose 3,5-epimerase family protein [Acidovorax sp. NCPPB 3576]